MKKLIYAKDAKTAQAIQIRLPEFKGATVHNNLSELSKHIEGCAVAAEFLPINLIEKAEQFIEANSGYEAEVKEYLPVEKIAAKMNFIRVFEATTMEYDAWKTENITPDEQPTAEAAE